MNNKDRQDLWTIYLTKAKCYYSNGFAAQAAQLFHRAEEVVADINGADPRRGVAYSWLALCYFKLANYTIAEDMFCRAEHIFTLAPESGLRDEIATNLASLAVFARQTGVLTCASHYYNPVLVSMANQIRAIANQSSRRQPTPHPGVRSGVRRMRAVAAKQLIDSRGA